MTSPTEVNAAAAEITGTPLEVVSVTGELVRTLTEEALGPRPYVVTGPRDQDADRLIFILNEGQEIEERFLHEGLPRVKSGSIIARDRGSFLTYVSRYKADDVTTYWADRDNLRVTAILDDQPTGPSADLMQHDIGQQGHRATLQLRKSVDWKAWLDHDDKLMGQEAFAEFLEDNAPAITSPPASTFVQIARTFTAKKQVQFDNGFHTESGAIKFEYAETVGARAGQKGEVEIPGEFSLAIRVFEGDVDAIEMGARFKYRLTTAGVQLGYRLIRPDLVLAYAFDAHVAALEVEVGKPIMHATW